MNFLLSIHYIVWIIISTFFFAIGEYASKKWALSPTSGFAIIVVLTYVLSSVTWLPAIFQKNQLSIVGVMWAVMSLVLTVLIGVIFFGEKLDTLTIVGIVLAVASVAILSME
ncbi:MAG: hypothetical protein WCF94_00860 [bacterium]